MSDIITAAKDYNSAQGKYVERMTCMTKNPREQLYEFRKRNKPTVILKMKPLNGSSGTPNMLKQPTKIDQGGKSSLRQRSHPSKVKSNRQMMTNYPFFFTRQEPANLADAPGWYQHIGKRNDGLIEKNTHSEVGGKTFPSQLLSRKQGSFTVDDVSNSVFIGYTEYKEGMEKAAQRENDQIQQTKHNQAKIFNSITKEKNRKDHMQQLIYDQKYRSGHYEQQTRYANEKGLGYTNVTQRGPLETNVPALRDTKFEVPTSVKGDTLNQLILLAELPPGINKALTAAHKKQPAIKFPSTYSKLNGNRQYVETQQKTQQSTEVNTRLNDNYSAMLKSAKSNRQNDEKTNMQVGNSLVESMFLPEKHGQRTPQSTVMQSFKPGSLVNKQGITTKRKRFMDIEAVRSSQNKSAQEHQNAPMLVTGDVPVGERRDPSNPKSYGNRKNFSDMQSNYSFKMQLQRQVAKAKKHQPNASLSKLIDLGEFSADHKLSNDNLIKNIADNFKQHRANLRHGKMVTAPGTAETPRSPLHNIDSGRGVAGLSPIRVYNQNSVSPGSVYKMHNRSASLTDDWKMQMSGTNHWKRNTQENTFSDSGLKETKTGIKWDQRSISSTNSFDYNKKGQTTPQQQLSRKRSIVSANNYQDVMSSNAKANPFKMSDRNKNIDKSSSILFKAPRGVDKSPERHYSTAFKDITMKARSSSTVQKLLPAVQALHYETGKNASRNRKVSVLALNQNSRPIHNTSNVRSTSSKIDLKLKQSSTTTTAKRNGTDQMWDTISNIQQERLQTQKNALLIHQNHTVLKPIRQYQTMEVFKEKRPACFNDPLDQARTSTMYNKTIAAAKDMQKMKVTGAGKNRDTLETPAQLKKDLLETSFQVTFQKEIDTYKTNNNSLFPRHKLSAAMIEQSKTANKLNKMHETKTNWGLRQTSQLSQRSSESQNQRQPSEDRNVIQQYYERQTKNEESKRQSVQGKIPVGAHLENHRLSPTPLVSQSPQHDMLRSRVILASSKEHAVPTKFRAQRNDSSRMSMSMHSDTPWVNKNMIGCQTGPGSPARQPSARNNTFAQTMRHNSSAYGNLRGQTISQLSNRRVQL